LECNLRKERAISGRHVGHISIYIVLVRGPLDFSILKPKTLILKFSLSLWSCHGFATGRVRSSLVLRARA